MGFEIRVDDPIGVEIRESFYNLESELPHALFRQLLVLLDDLEQISARTIFKNYPQMIPSFVPIVKL